MQRRRRADPPGCHKPLTETLDPGVLLLRQAWPKELWMRRGGVRLGEERSFREQPQIEQSSATPIQRVDAQGDQTRRHARRLALLLMAASSLFMIALVILGWLALARFL